MPRRPTRTPIEVTLPELLAFEGEELTAGERYDAVELRGLDLSGSSAPDLRFLECGLVDCRLDGAVLRGAQLADSVLADVRATSLDVAESSWRDVVVRDCRFGALSAAGSTLNRVRFSGGKVDFVNLRGSELTDVRFEGLRLGEVDLGLAQLRRVQFVDCRVDSLNVSGATLDQLDLSRATLQVVEGIGSLAGATVSRVQLTELAPALAEHLGIQVAELSGPR